MGIPEVSCGSNNGRRMPVIGMGTLVYPLVESELKAAVLCAIKVGYRHFDTASIYLNDQPLGEAISEALQLGLIKSRDELFITSKLWCTDAHPDAVLPALQNTLRNLQLEYLDLYLVHMPISLKPGSYDYPTPKEDLLPMDFESVWADMEKCQSLGLTKSIGVSNFSCKKLEIILANAKIPPAVNQVEMNPYWQQKKLKEFCKAKGITITAFSPFGKETNNLAGYEVLNAIVKAKGKSYAQVCVRWVYEQGASILVRSFNEERMKENLEIFDWELSEEDLKKISEIPQSRSEFYNYAEFVSPDGPFKTLEELWDGEILSSSLM